MVFGLHDGYSIVRQGYCFAQHIVCMIVHVIFILYLLKQAVAIN